jgi:hypothetical protein
MLFEMVLLLAADFAPHFSTFDSEHIVTQTLRTQPSIQCLPDARFCFNFFTGIDGACRE